MATVDLIDVSKKVGATTILDKINVSIQKGEFMVVVGPSGCGKSSLLRLISGLDSISSGKILINGQCVNHISPAERDMAMVFQSYALYPHMTVFDNMAYGLKMRRVAKAQIHHKVSEVAKLLQLTPFLARKPGSLSGGQKQRVAMGRAMVRSPAVFLFDEPLSNLDAQLRTEMRHEIRRLHQQFNTTSIYVTHDQTEAMTMADRVIVINQGVLQQIGKPQALYQSPATLFVAGFTGHYPVNFISAIYDKPRRILHTNLGIDYPEPHWTEEVVDQQELTLAIRAEHMQCAIASHPKAVEVNIEFVDDMGADKLVQTHSVINQVPLHLRIPAEYPLSSGQVYVELPTMKLHVFDKNTTKRIGEWCG